MATKLHPRSDSLEATSPYELRVNQSIGASESFVRRSLQTGDVGFLHSFTTGSTVDGPGVRVVAWTAGCPWRCLYCHNPDTWSMIHGRAVPLERAVAELRKYRRGLKVMSGGFTLSGGEPLLQDRFAVRLFAAAHDAGIHTALDTSGFLGDRLSDDEVRRIDLVLLDLKTWGEERHRRLTGKEMGPTLDFARRLSALQRAVWVRFVLVPGLTDDPDIASHIAKFAAGLGVVQRVDVLPFHQLGRYKWDRLGIPYTLRETKPPSPDLVERICAVFRAEGLQAF
jgi:pyruvate formate lyase activating enzyme